MDSNSEYAKSIFGRISADYDKINDKLTLRRHRSWKRVVADAIYDHGAITVLDLCTGTGDMAVIASQLPSVKKVVAVDNCPEMLEVTRKKLGYISAPASGWVPPELILADAEHLPFPESCVQCVTICQGLRCASSPPEIIRQSYRVLKPGGLIIVLEACRPMGGGARFATGVRNRIILPIAAGKHRKDYAWLRDDGHGFYTAEELATLMEQTGFRSVRQKSIDLGRMTIHRAIK